MLIAIRSLKVDQRCIPNSFLRFLDVFSIRAREQKEKEREKRNKEKQLVPTQASKASAVMRAAQLAARMAEQGFQYVEEID